MDAYAVLPMDLAGAAAHRDRREDEDYYSQPGGLCRLMNAGRQQALFDNIAALLAAATRSLNRSQAARSLKVDAAQGAGAAKVFGIAIEANQLQISEVR